MTRRKSPIWSLSKESFILIFVEDGMLKQVDSWYFHNDSKINCAWLKEVIWNWLDFQKWKLRFKQTHSERSQNNCVMIMVKSKISLPAVGITLW